MFVLGLNKGYIVATTFGYTHTPNLEEATMFRTVEEAAAFSRKGEDILELPDIWMDRTKQQWARFFRGQVCYWRQRRSRKMSQAITPFEITRLIMLLTRNSVKVNYKAWRGFTLVVSECTPKKAYEVHELITAINAIYHYKCTPVVEVDGRQVSFIVENGAILLNLKSLVGKNTSWVPLRSLDIMRSFV